jgi:hypothetical protein
MAQRETLSKKIRFEVFKRDKFTCQYCGAKAPDVVLNVDHITPVAKGGTNEIMNLITSCFSCNNGKRDKKLDDGSVVKKQRKQLELLQKRREQIELMLEWKKSLSSFDDDVIKMLIDHINSKIQPFSFNENGKTRVTDWMKKFSTEQILDAIDISAKQYLQYENEKVEQTSVEIFIKKIGGIIAVKNMPPIKQKLAYIKGIARNRFSYWNEKEGAIILDNYVKELGKHYDEEQLLNDLEKEVSETTKEATHWSEWKDTIEKWTLDIKKWEKPIQSKSTTSSEKKYSLEELEYCVDIGMSEQNNNIKALIHVATIFPKFDKGIFFDKLYHDLLNFLLYHNNLDDGISDFGNAKDYIVGHIQTTGVINLFAFDENTEKDLGVLVVLEPIAINLLTDIFMNCYYPIKGMKTEYLKIMIELNIKKIKRII